jgi:uncharacterized membrane protein YedE/YeeE
MRSQAAPEGIAGGAPPLQPGPLLIALAAVVLLGLGAVPLGARLPALAAIGMALGFVLAFFSFGFAGALRQLIVRRDDSGAQAILAMVGFATLLFALLLARESVAGRPLGGAVAPAGVQVAAGAFLFAIGMQIAGGCASGSLHAAGLGAGRALLAIAAFCVGGFWASLHLEAWTRLPALRPHALGESLGWPAAVAVQLAFIAALALVLRRGIARGPLLASTLRPLLVAGLLLAALNAATLAVAGHPWSITWAFTPWAAKAALALGWDPASSAFWAGGATREALEAPLLADVTTVMNLAIVAGAMAATASRGRHRWTRPGSWRLVVAAVAGGLAMGYGARIAFGCNVGAFFSGAASTSAHGWLWLAAALPGSWVGVRLRPLLGLRV